MSPEQLQKIANLSYLRVESEAEMAQLHADVQGVVRWLGQISQVDTEGVQPMLGTLDGTPTRLRPDQVLDGGLQEQVLSNARHKDMGFFVVPKVVDLEDT